MRPLDGDSLGLLVGLGADRDHAGDHARCRQALGVEEASAVVGGQRGTAGVDEVSDRVGKPQLGGPDRTLRRRAEQPRLRALRQPGERSRVAGERVVARHAVLQQGEQLGELLREVVRGALAAVTLQREHRHRIGARRAADAKVDPLRVQPGQGAEHLRHLQRAVVRQHHAAAPHTDPLGGLSHRRDQYLGSGARERGRGVVLGEPVALVPEPLGVTAEVDRVVERLSGGRSLRDGRLVEDAETHE